MPMNFVMEKASLQSMIVGSDSWTDARPFRFAFKAAADTSARFVEARDLSLFSSLAAFMAAIRSLELPRPSDALFGLLPSGGGGSGATWACDMAVKLYRGRQRLMTAVRSRGAHAARARTADGRQ